MTRFLQVMAPGLSPPVAGGTSPSARVDALDRTAQHDRPPLASIWPSSASMKPWLSMMPVEGESSAATQASSGSSACAALPPMGSRSVTPFLAAVSWMAASLANWLSCVATSSLPQRACGTLFSAQKR